MKIFSAPVGCYPLIATRAECDANLVGLYPHEAAVPPNLQKVATGESWINN